MANLAPTYHTLEDIQQRKNELAESLGEKRERIGTHWYALFAPKKATTRGEMVTGIISNCITAFDAFMLARKLMKQYGHFFRRDEGKKKKGIYAKLRH